jgi:sugar diacid utilization regulator
VGEHSAEANKNSENRCRLINKLIKAKKIPATASLSHHAHFLSLALSAAAAHVLVLEFSLSCEKDFSMLTFINKTLSRRVAFIREGRKISENFV